MSALDPLLSTEGWAYASLRLDPDGGWDGRAAALEPVPVANRVQAWTVGARRALEHDWDGRAPTAR